MSGSEALIGWRGARSSAPKSRYGGMRFISLRDAEAHANRPAYFARLLNLLRRKGKSREDAEDLIQEAMLRLHVYAKGVAVMNEEAFLRRAVHNLAIDQYRRDRFGLRQELPSEDVDRQNPLIASGPTPDQILDDQQRLDEITARLDAVNPRTKEIYFAHRLGYSYAEIAKDMSISKITVRRHIARALMTIKRLTDKISDRRSVRYHRIDSCDGQHLSPRLPDS